MSALDIAGKHEAPDVPVRPASPADAEARAHLADRLISAAILPAPGTVSATYAESLAEGALIVLRALKQDDDLPMPTHALVLSAIGTFERAARICRYAQGRG